MDLQEGFIDEGNEVELGVEEEELIVSILFFKQNIRARITYSIRVTMRDIFNTAANCSYTNPTDLAILYKGEAMSPNRTLISMLCAYDNEREFVVFHQNQEGSMEIMLHIYSSNQDINAEIPWALSAQDLYTTTS